MKIDKATIDHNALRLMDGMTTDMFGMTRGEGTENISQDIVMYCRGVIDLADKLKKVIEA